MSSSSGAWHADVQETLGIAMAPSHEEKSHTNGAQEITKVCESLDSLLTDSKSTLGGVGRTPP